MRPATRAITSGRAPRKPGDPLSVPPVFASGFHANGTLPYARDGSPTWSALEDAVGSLEGGEAVAFASGMGAAAAVFEDIPAGGEVLMPSSGYVEARRLLAERHARGQVRLREVEAADTEAMLRALPGASLLWLESLTNPMLEVTDLATIIPAARDAGVVVVVDATLATPMLQRPLELGADVVLHSATKFIGGHSDLLLGVATTTDPARAQQLRNTRASLGTVPGVMEAFLGLRGLRTLPLRIEQSQSSASELSLRLETHPAVRAVRYPGLESHPDHELAKQMLDGFGGLIAFELSGGREHADEVCARVCVFTHATSLGGVESVIERSSRVPGENRVPAGLLRTSIGCEDPADLWADLEQALGREAVPQAAVRIRPPRTLSA